jgi:2-polyprenyl-3-methyl-5-hydroxy-6-metoxy-1,4-benzoquinol methylase
MKKHSICPWWIGYTFLIPFRKWQHNPDSILNPYIQPGMKVMDYGSAMGYFSIPMAQKTGVSGKVYCVDIQEKMLAYLSKRAGKHGVSGTIETLLIGKSFNAEKLAGSLDFILLFMVVHEVPDKDSLFKDFYGMLKPGGKILFFEPGGHVNPQDFESSITIAEKAGLVRSAEEPSIKGLSVVLTK